MSWAPALMLALIPLIAVSLGLYIHSYLRTRPRRNRYRNALPPPSPHCERWPSWRAHAAEGR